MSDIPQGLPIPARAGIGLRFAHHAAALSTAVAPWLEVHPENYLDDAGMRIQLEDIARRHPLSLHAVGLSLGSPEGPDTEQLERLAVLNTQLRPALVSDHLSFSRANGWYLPDLLPLPYTREALYGVTANVKRVQQRLERQILIENPSRYLSYASSEMSEARFLAELVDRSGCGVLLDINNIAVCAHNLCVDAAELLQQFLDTIPADAIRELHLAGHSVVAVSDTRTLWLDDHGSPIDDGVWRLYEQALRCLGARPTLIEWDTAVPELHVLQQQAALAQRRLDALQLPEIAHAVAV